MEFPAIPPDFPVFKISSAIANFKKAKRAIDAQGSFTDTDGKTYNRDNVYDEIINVASQLNPDVPVDVAAIKNRIATLSADRSQTGVSVAMTVLQESNLLPKQYGDLLYALMG